MKVNILLPLIFILVSSCNSFKRENFNYQNTPSNSWINSYKFQVFYSCIKEGIKNDTVFRIIKENDFLNTFDGIDVFELDKASLIGKNIILKMPKSIIPNCDDCDENLENRKKNIIDNCLKYYASRELDSIAKEEYQKHLKNDIIEK